MNITSEPTPRRPGPARLIPWIAAFLAVAGCIQGPWDYYPERVKPFRGIWLTGYALSGKPLEQVCFERLLELHEESTKAFPFYDSAEVSVTGSFGGTVRALPLTPLPDLPNCFRGDGAALPEQGQAYALSGRFVWDSAGRPVTSVLRATARIPADFSIRRTATAPSLALTGGVPENIYNPEFAAKLPAEVRQTMVDEFPDLVRFLTPQADTTGLGKFILVNGKKIQERLVELLEQDKIVYDEGDTLFYLNGALNTLSHYFTSDRTPDVKGVLITHRFDTLAERPETRFDRPLGLKPDSSDYYFRGDVRRLLLYPEATGRQGWSLLDSMGVVNVWFHTRRNRLYFCGFEKAYPDYIFTAVDGESDPKIKAKYNVEGGRGVFAGGVPDSFDVNIVTDTLTKSYPMQAVRAAECREDGWFSDLDCRGYYRVYCAAKGWKEKDCGQDAIRTCMEVAWRADTLGGMCDSVGRPAQDVAEDRTRAETRFCIDRNFPADSAACAAPKTQCQATKGRNPCKDILWDFCKDNQWRPEACGLGLVSYCRDKPRLSETLCKRADAFCRDHPEEVLCR